MLNSHDGSTAVQLGFGVYRLACANGLVVCTANLGAIRLIHSGLNLDAVFNAATKLTDRAPEVADTVARWSGTQLDHDLALQMSSRMARARWGDRFVEADLLAPRRSDDTRSDLWTVFNRAQGCHETASPEREPLRHRFRVRSQLIFDPMPSCGVASGRQSRRNQNTNTS